MLNIYIPIDVNNIYSGNPFDTQLISAIELSGCAVDFGLFRLAAKPKHWDIVNIQWPEALFSWREPTQDDLSWLEECLVELGKTSKIVVTVHNDKPHYRGTAQFAALYKLIYKHAAAFVHLGRASEAIIKSQYPRETDNKTHRVIPHGNYNVFGDRVAKDDARELLKLPRHSKIVLVLGTIRSQEEFSLIRDSLNGCIKDDVLFLFRCKPYFAKPKFQYGSMFNRLLGEINQYRFESAMRHNPNVIYQPGEVPHEQMAHLLSAVDVLLVPRMRSLNSGNVPLGFTYGNVVVGPDTGNIGEILRTTGNPVFQPTKISVSIADAIQRGLELKQSGLGELNEAVARLDWCWETIGVQYRNLYEELMR